MFAGNEDMHKSLVEFEIRPDATTRVGKIPGFMSISHPGGNYR